MEEFALSGFALALVLMAAFLHASWNFLAKRVAGGAPFLWLITVWSSLLYAPLAIGLAVASRPSLDASGWMFIVGSSILHTGYFIALQRGYRVGDLSVVYPLARGTGPMLAALVAIAVMGERPTPLALSGIVLVGLGVFVLSNGLTMFRRGEPRDGFVYGLLTGVLIAAYTLWDNHAVSALFIPPLLFDWAANVIRVLSLTPFVVHRFEDVRQVWRHNKWETIGVAALSPLSYILVLSALVFTPVSYIAPAREISIVIGTAMGARLLAEEAGPRRVAAACAIVLGVAALAIG